MALLAGIDEAGFGPLLGPLIVSGVAFRVPDDAVNGCLWTRLSDSCAREFHRSDRRLAIADSKKLYRGGDGLGALERTALVMLHLADRRPVTWREILGVLAPSALRDLEAYPWYAATDFRLPIGEDVGDVGTRANSVRRNAREQDVEFLGAFCAPLLEGDYNKKLQHTRNKATTLVGQALEVLERVCKSCDEKYVRICIDRLGGRSHYRDVLQTAFPGFELQILEETADRSAYKLVSAARVCLIDFTVSGEDRHLPIALASVYSKYLRELYMHLFNAYWSRQMKDLRPTAGYYNDARRWLKDAAPAIRRLSINRKLLVRSR